MLSDCRLVRLLYSHFYAPVFIFFLIVRTYFYPCILVWIKHQNIKTSKVLIFFLLKTFQHEYQILNSNIYHRNNITTNSWILIFAMTILQLKTFKTQITTNTKALVYNGLPYGFQYTLLVVKRIRISWGAGFSHSQPAVNHK